MDESQEQDLPEVLIIQPPYALPLIESHFPQKFRLLKAWESPLPLDQYLTTYASSVQALVCYYKVQVNAYLLRLLPALKLVTSPSAGVNNIDVAECRRRGVSVTTSGAAYAEDVADFAVGLFIDVQRKISAGDRYVRQGLWSSKGDYHLGSELRGKRVGIVGFGKIGAEVAKRLEAFGCMISYNSRIKKPSASYPFYSNVHELAADSDALIICCALTEETRHLINKEILSALGKEGVIVNIARGPIIDEKELVRCLVEGEIAGAGLDVFENEPHVPRELLGLDNVVLSPHRAVYTPEAFEKSAQIVVSNLEAFFSNQPLLTPFNG